MGRFNPKRGSDDPPARTPTGKGQLKMDRSPDGTWRFIQGASVVLVLVFFLLSLSGLELGGLLTPFILFWVLVATLLPFRGESGYWILLSLVTILTFFWLLHTTGFLLAPFVLALVLAYILDPVVDRMEGRRLGRSLAIILLAFPILVLLGIAVVLGIPALAQETGELIQRAPEFLERLATWLETVWDSLLRVDLPLVDEEELLSNLRSVDSAAVITFLDERKEVIFSGIWGSVLGLGKGLGSIVTIVGYVVLTPVITFYLLRDFDGLKARISDLLPGSARPGILDLAGEYDGLLSRYLRGQITVALIMGVITAVGLLVLRFPYAILLGVLVAVFSVVPYLGLALSLIPALFIAFVSGNVLVSLVKIAVVYGASQGLEGAVISPRIVGESVGLHPVWVVLALAVGGFFFGFVGLLIGVPLAVGVKLLVVRGVDQYRKSDLFRGVSRVRE
jgi:predicted PurR-regulated permease PerM